MAGKQKEKGFEKIYEFKSVSPTDDEAVKPAPSSTKRSNSDYLRLYVGDCKEYLVKIAALETQNTGRQVSISKYVLGLIEADKEKREKEL